jgi:murein DD-endopeptidase MepM/ murein hydrolase activator NlpD
VGRHSAPRSSRLLIRLSLRWRSLVPATLILLLAGGGEQWFRSLAASAESSSLSSGSSGRAVRSAPYRLGTDSPALPREGLSTSTATSATSSAGSAIAADTARYFAAVAGARPVSRAKRIATAAPKRRVRLDPNKTVAGTWVRPSVGPMSSCFCMRWGVMHEGVDLAGPLGAPIYSTGQGVVVEAGPSEGFGHWIVIRQANGDVTIYGHMYSVLVSTGEHVRAGQHIADIGADGQSTGPHLHFGVRRGGITGPYLDPVPWLRARGVYIDSPRALG